MKPKLEYASKGPYVQEAQMKLNALVPQQPLLLVDGVYGNKTVARVKQFQMSRALVADGIVGAKTWAALDGAAPAVAGGSPGVPGGTPGSKLPGKVSPPATAGGGTANVYAGALLICNCGLAPSSLRINDPGRAVGVVRDSVANVNFAPFGMCGSMQNPVVAAATQAAMGLLTRIPCTPVIAGAWSPPGAPITLIGSPPSPALGRSSTLTCVYGGTITIAG